MLDAEVEKRLRSTDQRCDARRTPQTHNRVGYQQDGTGWVDQKLLLHGAGVEKWGEIVTLSKLSPGADSNTKFRLTF